MDCYGKRAGMDGAGAGIVLAGPQTGAQRIQNRGPSAGRRVYRHIRRKRYFMGRTDEFIDIAVPAGTGRAGALCDSGGVRLGVVRAVVEDFPFPARYHDGGLQLFKPRRRDHIYRRGIIVMGRTARTNADFSLFRPVYHSAAVDRRLYLREIILQLVESQPAEIKIFKLIKYAVINFKILRNPPSRFAAFPPLTRGA